MTRTSEPQLAYNSGEISPLLRNRPDYQRWQTGIRAGNGWLALREGGITRAPGTIYRGEIADETQTGRLISFEFAIDDAVTLEFTPLLMRVWRYGQLYGSPVFELVTPYDAAAIARLQWRQSADVIYFCDGVLPQQKLIRFALDNWTISDFVTDDGPFNPVNLDTAWTITPSATTGTGITLTASQATFTADMIGSLMSLQPEDRRDTESWVGNETVAATNLRRRDQVVYKVASGTNTGVDPPTHLEGRSDYNGIKWDYVEDGFGIVRITGVTSGTVATADVIRTLSLEAKNNGTYLWAEGAWSDKNGYPAAIEIIEQRLAFAATATRPRTIWFSATGGFTTFKPGVLDDDAFAYAISGSTTLNRILWLSASTQGLVVGALGQLLAPPPSISSSDNALTPSNFGLKPAGVLGVSDAIPIDPDGRPIFITRDGRRLMEARFNFGNNNYDVVELSAPSSHLGNVGFAEIQWQSGQQRTAWIRRTDGTLAIMLHDPLEKVLAWVPMSIAGGMVESIAVSPDATTGLAVVTMIVQRTIDGAVRRFVEEVAPVFGADDDTVPISEAIHLYCATEFVPGAPTDTFAVPHLEGEDVIAWTDKGHFEDLTAGVGGVVTLPDTVSRAIIGLYDDTHEGETLAMRPRAQDGDTLGRKKRLVPGSGISLYRTAALSVAARSRDPEDGIYTSQFESAIPLVVMAQLDTEFTGENELETECGWAYEVSTVFKPFGGAPATILGMTPMVEEAGG